MKPSKIGAALLSRHSEAMPNAIIDDHTDLLLELLTYPNQQRFINSYYGVLTPLHLSLSHHNYTAMVALLRHNADPSLRFRDNPGFCPLHMAIKNNDLSAIRLLILYNADLDTLEDADGNTPLTLARQNGEILKLINQTKDVRFDIAKEESLAESAEKEGAVKKAAQHYQCLASSWHQLAEQEKQPDIKAHYLSKSQDYLKKIQSEYQEINSAVYSGHRKKELLKSSGYFLIACCQHLFSKKSNKKLDQQVLLKTDFVNSNRLE